MADTKAPPAPTEPSVYAPPAPATPPPAVTIGWASPPSQAKTPAGPKRAKRRALPAGPALAAAGNGAVIVVTSAYEAGGLVGLAGAAGVVVVGTAGAVARRRQTVRSRQASVRAGRAGSPWAGSGSSAGRLSGSGGTGSAGGSRRGAGSGSAGSRTGSGLTGSGTPRTSAGTGSGSGRPGSGHRNPGSGSGGTSALNRLADRLRGGNGKTTKANRSSKAKGSSRTGPTTPGRLARTAAGARSRTAQAWAADRPRRQRNRRAAADALRALLPGLCGAIRHRSLRAGAQRALAAWRARRTRATAAPPQPTVASTVRRPTTTAAPTPGAPAMPGHHFVAPAMEAAAAAARYHPTGMVEVIADFAGMQQACELEAEAIRITVERADAEFPLDPRVVDIMRQIHSLKLKAAELAQELQPAARQLHAADLQRHESPRKGYAGERMWDVGSN